MQNNINVILTAVLFLFAVFIIILKLIQKKSKKLPYKKKEYLLTQAENSFYSVLKLALKDMDVNIFAKMRLCDIVYIPKGTKNWQTYWNKIKSKHVDFIISTKNGNKPLLVIELNDSSHNSIERMERDEFVENVLSAAGIPLIFIPVQHSYNVNDLLNKIKDAILG